MRVRPETAPRPPVPVWRRILRAVATVCLHIEIVLRVAAAGVFVVIVVIVAHGCTMHVVHTWGR